MAAGRIKEIFYRFPLSLRSILLLPGLVFLIYNAWQSESLILWLIALLCLVLFLIILAFGFLLSRGAGRSTLIIDEIDYSRGLCIKAHGEGGKTPLFFRRHLLLSGGLYQGKRKVYDFMREEALALDGSLLYRLSTAYGGVLRLRADFYLRDIFGFSRFHLSKEEGLAIPVWPRVDEDSLFPAAAFASERKQEQGISNENIERYQMREYQMGDKLRDINWKSSGRSGQLFTRIDPESPKPRKLVYLLLRLHIPSHKNLPLFFRHSDAIKVHVMRFIRKSLEEEGPVCLRVCTVDGHFDVDSTEAADHLQDALLEMSWNSSRSDWPESPEDGQLLLFSSEFDLNLAQEISKRPQNDFHVFLTRDDSGRFYLKERFFRESLLLPGRVGPLFFWPFKAATTRLGPMENCQVNSLKLSTRKGAL